MIPRRAFYTWSGPPESMPWLRRLTVETFKKFNPDWEVEHIHSAVGDELIHAATWSDLRRYVELEARGGLYFDTDIVFLAPIPDTILEHPFAITMDPSVLVKYPDHEPHPSQPGFSNIGLMAATHGHDFFRDVLRAAQEKAAAGVESYQGLGVELLNGMFWGEHEPDIRERYGDFYNIPLDAILPIRWWRVYKLFNGTPFEPPPGCIGVHWYGGSPESRRFCQRVTAENYQGHPCYLQKAIDRALE